MQRRSSAANEAIESATARIEIIRPVLSFGRLALTAAIIGVSAAIGTAVRSPRDAAAHRDEAALLFASTGLYLTVFAFTRWHMFHTLATPRLVAAATCLALIALAPRVPAATSVALLAVLLIVLNLVEHRLVPRSLHRIS